MKSEGHRETGNQLEESARELMAEPERHVKAIIELVFGAAHHYAAAGLEERYGEHPEKHQQIPGFLRKKGELEVSLAFESIDGLRAGRFYGRKGNGDIVKQAQKNLEVIKRWLG
ncbi:MAG: hypothetical protein D6733_01980 [Methanobacteriota archaeon]|nr:MAG: hypothetical protein D6733_01980 [Euryarchaeota archaeon]